MRASEFLNEDKEGKISKRAEQATQGVMKARDVGGYDRVYWLNRAMMAAACADGEDEKKLDLDSSSWSEKFNTIHPYTEKEWKMMKQVIATVPTESQTIVPWSPSMEPESTNAQSLVKPFKGYKRK